MTTATIEAWLPEIVDRLAREFRPLKIYLFGSQARGDTREHSDVDLLVVFPKVEDKRKTALALRDAVGRSPVDVQVFVADPEEIARTGDSVGSFVYPVLREGRVIYGVDDRDEQTWLRYAEEDLATAERMMEGRGFAFRWACFLAQQAAEKALKAVLVHEAIQFPFMHELDKLSELVPAGLRVASLDLDLKGLTRWATIARYPSDEREPGETEAREAVAAARAVVEAAREDVGGA